MDSQESPPAQKQQQEQPQPPQGYGIMASPPNPPPLQPPNPQPYQQEQQPPPPHRHGAMEATSTQPPPQPQTHQQEKINSYILPAKIIFHQSQEKKKRGRPRRSFDDGLRFSPTLTSKAPGASPSEKSSDKSHESLQRSRKKELPQALDSNVVVGGGGGVACSENLAKKFLERPLCSGNKQKQEDLGVVGSGWTPHSIHVNIGEDIVGKVMTFTQQEPRRQIVNIISASGVICDVTLRKFAIGGGTVTYEGQFVIISLSGSLLLSESNGSLSITGDLSVSLTGPDNKVLCGVVSGKLKAASPVQVVLSSFIQDNVLNFGASITKVTSSSQGASSNSADENGGSPDLNHE